jgi:alpha-mannosidase
MKVSELAVLLPCHSLEDFPVYHEGAEADQLLAAWCSLWHPALLAAAGTVPVMHRVDMPPELLEGRLIAVPPFCVDRLPAGYVARAEAESAGLVRAVSRDEGVQAALNALGGSVDGVEPELAADYLALGFCRLQMELLTRQMRYSVNIDETHFSREAIAGATAAVAGDEAKAREHLAHCFETLLEARNRFYPVDVYLLDLTLLAETTLGESLTAELDSDTPKNLFGPTGLLDALNASYPATWAKLLSAIDRGAAHVLGGEVQERALPLLPLETARESLVRGARRYEELLGRLPPVYARRRAGLWPHLPQMLVKLGYQGALHFTLDDGRFPLPAQAKTRWEGIDASTLDAYCHLPSDAAKPETFLGLARKTADSMDNDHVATVVFAHWPGAASVWYDELRRVARLSPVLGKFTLLDDYFAHTDMPGRLSKFEPDQYRTPYLKQAIQRRQSDAISAFVREHRTAADQAAAQTVTTLAELVRGRQLETRPDLSGTDIVREAQCQLAGTLPRISAPAGERWLVVNPLCVRRKLGVELPPGAELPAVADHVVAAGAAGERRFAVVDVPAMGFAWLEPSSFASSPSRGKSIAAGNKLTNEFLELTVSSTTGGIQSIYDFKHRGNQLSQQIAYRLPPPPGEPGMEWQTSDEATYTTMRAEHVEVTASCAAFGEIVSRGELLDGDGQRMARFRQTLQVWAASRVIGLEVELYEVTEPRADPWNSYCALRFAWPDAAAELFRGVGLIRARTDASRLEAPEYVDVESPGGRITLLTGGLPYHRRSEGRMLDSLLVVRGERERRFRVGIGVSLTQPAAAALELLTPGSVLADHGSPGATATGWFFHVDARNVVATHWEPLLQTAETPEDTATPGVVTGFRVRLLETAGRSGRVTLRAFRPVAKARQVDFLAQTLLQCTVDGDKITLDFASHEWLEVEVVWAS